MSDEVQSNKKPLILLITIGVFLFLGLIAFFVYKAVDEPFTIIEDPIQNENKLDEGLIKERLAISQKSQIIVPKADLLTQIQKEDLPQSLSIFVPTDSTNEVRYLKLDFKDGEGFSFLYNKNGELAQIFSDFFDLFQDSNILYSGYSERFGMIEIEGARYQIQINLVQLGANSVEVSIQVLPKSL